MFRCTPSCCNEDCSVPVEGKTTRWLLNGGSGWVRVQPRVAALQPCEKLAEAFGRQLHARTPLCCCTAEACAVTVDAPRTRGGGVPIMGSLKPRSEPIFVFGPHARGKKAAGCGLSSRSSWPPPVGVAIRPMHRPSAPPRRAEDSEPAEKAEAEIQAIMQARPTGGGPSCQEKLAMRRCRFVGTFCVRPLSWPPFSAPPKPVQLLASLSARTSAREYF